MRQVVAVLALVWSVAAGTAAADDKAGAAHGAPPAKADPAIGRCMKRVRTDRTACVRTAIEHCRTTFEANVVDCYGSSGADCARSCIATQTRCREEPQTDQDGCKLACSSDERVARKKCKIEPDLEACETKAKLQGMQCKQACTSKAEPRLRACMVAFDACLVGCAGPRDGKAAP